jgi:hypothetical protein
MVKGEAMNRWGHTPIENIAYALLKISATLERMENKMPVPEGEITTSEIFAAEEAQDIADFDVVFEMNEDKKIEWDEVKKELEIENDLPELS